MIVRPVLLAVCRSEDGPGSGGSQPIASRLSGAGNHGARYLYVTYPAHLLLLI
jgi:hypothetical protein